PSAAQKASSWLAAWWRSRASLVGFLGGGEASLLHVLDEARECRGRALGEIGVLTHQLGVVAGGESQRVVPPPPLAVAASAGAEADGGDAEGAGDAAGELGRHALEHQRESPRVLERPAIGEQALGALLAPPLHAVAAELEHGLRREPDVAHHRNPGLDDDAHR